MNPDDEWWCSLDGDEIDRNTAGDPPYDVDRVAVWIASVMPGRCDRILDFGAGTGRLTEAVQKMMPETQFFGLEIAPKIRARLKERCPWCFTMDHIPSLRSVYHGAYSVTVLQHLDYERAAEAIEKITEGLKRGGVFVFQYDRSGPEHAGPHNYPITDRTAALWCRLAGLEVELVDDNLYEEWGWAIAMKP